MWAFLLPPVGVALRGAPLPIVMINLLFTLLGWLPGCIHAIITIAMMGSAEQAAAAQMQSQQQYIAGYQAANGGAAPPPTSLPPVAPVTYSYVPAGLAAPVPVPPAVVQQVATAAELAKPDAAAPAAPAAANTTAPAAGGKATYPKV